MLRWCCKIPELYPESAPSPLLGDPFWDPSQAPLEIPEISPSEAQCNFHHTMRDSLAQSRVGSTGSLVHPPRKLPSSHPLKGVAYATPPARSASAQCELREGENPDPAHGGARGVPPPEREREGPPPHHRKALRALLVDLQVRVAARTRFSV